MLRGRRENAQDKGKRNEDLKKKKKKNEEDKVMEVMVAGEDLLFRLFISRLMKEKILFARFFFFFF